MLVFIFVLYCLFLLSLSALKSAGLLLSLILQLEAMLGGDKLMHLQLAAILSLLACLASQMFFVRKTISLTWQLLAVFVVLSTSLLLDELHQYLLSSRHFELMDTVFGILGIAIGLVVYCALVMIKNYRAKIFRI